MPGYPFNTFIPKPGHYGDEPRLHAAALAATASSTVNQMIGTPAITGRSLYIQKITLKWKTAAAGSGAITVKVTAQNSAGTDRDICAATSLTSSILTGTVGSIDVPITATDANRIIAATDSLRAIVVAAGTVTTQVEASVVVEYQLLS